MVAQPCVNTYGRRFPTKHLSMETQLYARAYARIKIEHAVLYHPLNLHLSL